MTRPLSIAHVSATFPPYYAGTGNVCFHNAAELASRGHRVSVYTADLGPAPAPPPAPFPVHRLRPVLRLGNAPLLPELLQLPRVDLVHLHYPFIFGAEAVLLGSVLRRQPYVVTYHNDLAWTGARGAIFSVYQRAVAPVILSRARRVLVTAMDFATSSPTLRGQLERRAGAVVEVPNGVDVDRFHPGVDATQVHRALDIRPGPQRVALFAGAMDAAHHLKSGVPVLLRAVQRLRDSQLVLVLAGDGQKVPDYRALAKQLGIGRQVRFAGRVPHESMPEYLAAADVVVQPSVLFEPFGMVAIEAMACGRPVIASDLPGARAVIQAGGGGVLVPAGDAERLAETLGALLADAPRRAALGAAGHRGVQARYAWTAVTDRLESAYWGALGTRGGPA